MPESSMLLFIVLLNFILCLINKKITFIEAGRVGIEYFDQYFLQLVFHLDFARQNFDQEIFLLEDGSVDFYQ